jgi:hypothetical protein
MQALVDTAALNEESSMPRRLNNLEKLLTDLQVRYGEDDDLVLQLKSEFETLKASQSSQKFWSIPYRDFIKSDSNKSGSPICSLQHQ